MDRTMRAYYEVVFEKDYLKKCGNEFQDFFSEIMEKCHPGDFQRVRPWGSVGDRKNDGYLRSERTLFQVYAPNEKMTARKAVTKIHEDFYGALLHWQQYFDKWIFVHDSRNGLGPDIFKTLLDLNAAHPSVTIYSWGYEELRQKIFTLNDADLASLLGFAPTIKDMLNLRYENVQEVVNNIARQKSSLSQEVRQVPPDKLHFNYLSEDVQVLLTWGMRKADLVGNFFNDHPNPQYGDEIALAFNKKYRECKIRNIEPDKVFLELQEFAGGQDRGAPAYEAAIFAVLAYLFEQCDIFERLPEEVTS